MPETALVALPESVQAFITITEIDDAAFVAGALFRRKFGDEPPAHGRHLAAFHRRADGSLRLAGYSHMLPFGDVYLSGGSCSEGETIRAMPDEQREALNVAGGIWHLILRYAFRKYADECDAFFGHCGDRRALEVALASGFERTDVQHIIVNWHKPLHPNIRRALLAKVAALGPF
jgi:hypothetical protein